MTTPHRTPREKAAQAAAALAVAHAQARATPAPEPDNPADLWITPAVARAIRLAAEQDQHDRATR